MRAISSFPRRKQYIALGFTLAELLIALWVLGVIAAFAIPKVLAGQQNTRYNAIAKEVAGMVGAASQLYLVQNSDYPNLSTGEILTPYMNYISIDSTAPIDDPVDYGGYVTCNSGAISKCYKLSNGAFLFFWTGKQFTSSNNSFVYVGIDVDGQRSGLSSDKALWFVLTKTGQLTTWGSYASNPSNDPSWFSW